MKKKKTLISILILVLLIMSFTVACSSNEKNQVDTQELPEFTLEELAEYDGKEGKPAYIAVDGIIYDVTDVREWKDGQHNGFEAGKDLTEAIKNQSPHGVSKLKNIKAVGKLVD